jgi:hypothetical protein
MRRRQLVELEDLPWLPETLRDALTDCLRYAQETSGIARLVLPRLERLLTSDGAKSIVDLCSGGGGPLAGLAQALAPAGTRIVATDLYPNRRAQAQLASSGVVPFTAPVDARRVPAELKGVRTLFMAFHHFRPEDARGILADAVEKRQPIAIFEIAERHPVILALTPLMAVLQLLSAPRQQPWRWSRILWTYLIPLAPLTVVFDGIVSCLRAYSLDELRELTAGLGGDDWRWELGRTPVPLAPARLTYLLGAPTSRLGNACSAPAPHGELACKPQHHEP